MYSKDVRKMKCFIEDCNEELEEITDPTIQIPIYRYYRCKNKHTFQKREEIGEKPQWSILIWLPLHEYLEGKIDWNRVPKEE